MYARKRYYNPKLDHHTMVEKMTPAMRKACDEDTYGWIIEETGGPLNEPDAWHPYNLVSSLCDDGFHRIAWDIDIPISCHPIEGNLVVQWGDGYSMTVAGGMTVPSSTPGHCHLYGTKPCTWEEYALMLLEQAGTGLLEPGYATASIARGQSLLRPVHVRKLSVDPHPIEG